MGEAYLVLLTDDFIIYALLINYHLYNFKKAEGI